MRVLMAESGESREKLHETLDSLDAVAIRPDAVESLEELELAEHLAKDSSAKKKNIAKQLRYEFLLWLAGTRDIKSAMGKTEPGQGRFLLVVFSDKEIPAELDVRETGLKRHAEPLALERISLSRLR